MVYKYCCCSIVFRYIGFDDLLYEFGVEALVILDGIGEFFNLAILFLELFAVGIKIQFLSINPVYMVVNGGHVLSDCVFVGLDCVDVVCDFGVFCHDNCL